MGAKASKVAASKARGAATRAANVKRASEQKTRALEKGGKFREGGKIKTVTLTGGRHFSINLNESVRFNDSISGTRISTRPDSSSSQQQTQVITRNQVQGVPSEALQKKKGKNLNVNLKESFSFGEPQPKKRIGAVAPFGGAFTSGAGLFVERDFVGPKQPKTGFDKFFDDLAKAGEGLGEELKNLAATTKEFSFGSGFVGTSGGKVIPTTKEAKEQNKALASLFTPNTVSEKLSSGKFDEIDLDDPKQVGQSLIFPVLALGPKGGGKAGQIAVGAVKGFREAKEIRNIEKFLGQKGLTEKIGTDLFITGGGTEKTPSALFVTQRGKASNFFEPGTTTKIIPDTKAILTPKDFAIRGKLDITTQKDLGLTLKPTEFQSFTKGTTPKGRRTFAKGQFENELKIIAKGQQIPTKDITKFPVEKGFKVPQQKQLDSIQNLFTRKGKSLAFGQTKATQPIKFETEDTFFKQFGPKQKSKGFKTPFDTNPFKPSKGGAGGSGRAKAFTKQEEKSITDLVKATGGQKTKGAQTFKPFGGTIQFQTGQQSNKQPPQKTGGLGSLRFKDEISAVINPGKQKGGSGFNLSLGESLNVSTGKKKKTSFFGGVGFRDEISLLTGKAPKITEKQGLKITEDFAFKLKPGTKLGDPFIPEIPPPPPPPPPTPKTNRIPPPPTFGIPVSFGEFTGGSKKSSRTVFGAFGISENINVGRLPGELSTFSTSPKVFKQLDKRDKDFQDLIFGKARRKKSKGKKPKSKKRARKR